MKNRFFIIFFLLPLICGAQVQRPMSFSEYMEQVRQQNLAYAAQKLDIPIADAEIRSAGIFNDPTLSLEYGYNDDYRMQMGQGMSAELSKTFSPGKRNARIGLARSEKEVTEALLDDFFRTLRADAATLYYEAVKQDRLYDLKLDSYDRINELAQADSIKFNLGKITETDALQSRIEAGVAYNELQQAKSDLQGAYTSLNVPLGRFSTDTLYVPTGVLEIRHRNFSLDDLLGAAVESRADLVAALKNVSVAERALNLTRKERHMDFDLAVGYNYNTEVRNELAPAPRFGGITVGVAIPLKFSNINKGAIISAGYRAAQAENYYRQAQLEVETEVARNYTSYGSICAQVDRFRAGVLDQARVVLEGKRYSYNRGESSLLELLNAQRTYNEVHALYIETLFNHIASLIALESSAGIWDIEG